MKNKPTITHIYPASGGIFDYAQIIDQVYELEGYVVKQIVLSETDELPVVDNQKTIVHIELGVNDSRLFWLSWRLAKSAKNKVVVTVHDPGKVIYNPSNIAVPTNAGSLGGLLYKVARKLVNSIIRGYVMRTWQRMNITKIYLNQKDAEDGRYLPHPTYIKDIARTNRSTTTKPVVINIGFSGYWGKWKGIDELVEACGQVVEKGFSINLVIAGDTVSKQDTYRKHISQLAKANSFINIIGFIPKQKFTNFLASLDVLVLPYHLEIPGGVSGIAQRAIELAVPIIATKTPALLGQIGKENAIFVEPASSESLAEGIMEFLNNKSKYNDLAHVVQEKVYRSNSWEQVGSQLSSIIGEVTNL